MTARLMVVSVALIIAGGGLSLRFLLQWGKALSRRYRRGVPYLYGSAGRAFLLLAGSLVLLAVGALLGSIGWGLSAYQPFHEATRAGTIRMSVDPDRTLSFRLVPAEGYPAGSGNSVAGLPPDHWSLVGRFILWHRSLHWLGLRDSHRVALILTVPNAEDIPRAESILRTPLTVSRNERLWNLLHRYDRLLPLAETREFQTPWRTGPVEGLQLYASRVGYLLAEE